MVECIPEKGEACSDRGRLSDFGNLAHKVTVVGKRLRETSSLIRKSEENDHELTLWIWHEGHHLLFWIEAICNVFYQKFFFFSVFVQDNIV